METVQQRLGSFQGRDDFLAEPLLDTEKEEGGGIIKHRRGGRWVSSRVSLCIWMLGLLVVIGLLVTLVRGVTGRPGWVWTLYGEFKLFPLYSCDEEGCTFEEAANLCETEGGHLPRVQGAQENDKIMELLKNTTNSVWIGLTNRYRRGSWQFYNTEVAATYIHFSGISSSTNLNTSLCALLTPDGRFWNKLPCSHRENTRGQPIMALCQRPSGSNRLDSKGRVMMGRSDCDDGETGVDVDLYDMGLSTTCQTGKVLELEVGVERGVEKCEVVHKEYVPNHICMDQKVDYSDFGRIPTHGPHRPNWAKFGEYSYVPPERYQHNLEHGTVVLLYHPCLDNQQIFKAKKVLTSCIWKHVITPSSLPSQEAPLILLAWGYYMEFRSLDLVRMKKFIKKHALSGPEGNYTKDGLYTHLLTRPATIPDGSDIRDSVICPQDKQTTKHHHQTEKQVAKWN